jgi:hypothetical protein
LEVIEDENCSIGLPDDHALVATRNHREVDMNIMKIDGTCHCGFLKYEAEIDLDRTGICHCEDCQKFSGSDFRGFAPAIEGTFKLLAGEPKRYEKVAASGNHNAMVFCPNCGTHICSTGAEPGSKFYGIRWVTARQHREIRPKMNIFCRSAQDWVWDIGSLPKHEAG